MTQTLPGAALRLSSLMLLALLFAGCAAQPEQPKPDPVEPDPVETLPEQVDLALPPSAFAADFRAAEAALDRGDWMSASLALPAPDDADMTETDVAYTQLLQARVNYYRGRNDAAAAALDELLASPQPDALRYRALAFRARTNGLSRAHLASAQDLYAVLALGSLDNSADWQRALWRQLQQVPRNQLDEAAEAAIDITWLGWLELARAGRLEGATRAAALQQWLGDYPGHPAAAPLPGGLDALLASPQQASRVALLLPLSGRLAPAGQAVLNGYLAAHYAAAGAGTAEPELLLLDSGDFESTASAYQQAVAQGAGLMIGPLDKQAVADLALVPQRPIPVLALNRTEAAIPASGSALVQLALAPEDEAAALAALAFGDGARRAVIISPRTSWGDSMRASLLQRWQALGGQVAASVTFDDPAQYSEGVRRVLGLGDSHRRAAAISALLDEELEFTPRRRQDADVIFLLARNATQARAIKPLLAFHYAGALPTYATSHAYTGRSHPNDRDLNGLRLLETPWLLGAAPSLSAPVAAVDAESANYPRLSALGADAFLLQAEFARLSAGPDALLRGHTGLLSMDPRLQIQRELPAATFDRGAIRPR